MRNELWEMSGPKALMSGIGTRIENPGIKAWTTFSCRPQTWFEGGDGMFACSLCSFLHKEGEIVGIATALFVGAWQKLHQLASMENCRKQRGETSYLS